MNAFAPAMNVIFVDPNLAVDALWFVGATGRGLAIRVLRKSPEITPFGARCLLSETTQLDARVVDKRTPAAGDQIRIGAEGFILQSEPNLDRERLIWALNMRPA